MQVCHEWNTAVHVQEAEGDPSKRAFTVDELQAFFDYADDQVGAVREAGRKGWLAAFRDAILFKAAYGYGLRRNEVRMLDVADFGANAHAPEFGEFGVCYVRLGKAMKGSPPKRRSVLTVWPWVAEVPGEWINEIRPLLVHARSPALWPTERSDRISLADRPPVRGLPGGARSTGRPGLPLTAAVLRHAPHRGRLGRVVRPAAGRSRTRLHHLDLHLRVLRLPRPHAPPRPG